MVNGEPVSPSRTPIADDDYPMHNGTGENGVGHYYANGHAGHTVTVNTTPHNNGDIHHATVERIARDWGVDSIDDVNAATAMLALKHGPKVFSETFQTG